MPNTAPQLSLKGRALRLLSGREHSRQELERRLAPQEGSPGQLAKILDELEAKGFISEARVVESVLNRRRAKLGTARIRQELQAKGVEREAVSNAVAALQSTEIERARALWQRKFQRGGVDTALDTEPAAVLSASERGKQIRYLASRGFSGDTIRRVLTGPIDED